MSATETPEREEQASKTPDGWVGKLNKLPSKALKWLLALGVIYLGLALFAGCLTAVEPDETRNFKPDEILLDGWGIDVSEPLPLTLGGVTQGTYGEIDMRLRTGLLTGSASAQGTIEPGSSVRLSLTSANRNYILEIPYLKVQFDTSATSPDEAEALFVMSDMVANRASVKVVRNFWSLQTVEIFRDEPTVTTMPAWPELDKLGPLVFLSEHIDTVHIKLTPQQYQAYLGAEFPGSN